MALARCLDGDGPAPLAWWVARLCEEFHCLPSAALREWETSPAGFLEDVLEARAFAATKAAIDRAPDRRSMPEGAMADLVVEVEAALAQAEIEGRANG